MGLTSPPQTKISGYIPGGRSVLSVIALFWAKSAIYDCLVVYRWRLRSLAECAKDIVAHQCGQEIADELYGLWLELDHLIGCPGKRRLHIIYTCVTLNFHFPVLRFAADLSSIYCFATESAHYCDEYTCLFVCLSICSHNVTKSSADAEGLRDCHKYKISHLKRLGVGEWPSRSHDHYNCG